MSPSATLNLLTGTARRRALSAAAGLLLVLPLVLVACEITEVTQPSSAMAGTIIDIEVVINSNYADVNPHKGVVSVMIPNDWSYVSGTYTGPGATGDMIEDAGWADSTESVTFLAAPQGYKWIGTISSGAHTVPADNTVYVADLRLQVGSAVGDYALSYFTTTDAFTVADFDFGDPTTNTADTLLAVPISVTPFVANESGPSDRAFRIAQNRPNPVGNSTVIGYTLDRAASIEISVVDLQGRVVANVSSGSRAAGTYSVDFDASALPNGPYLYRITADGAVAQTRMMTVAR